MKERYKHVTTTPTTFPTLRYFWYVAFKIDTRETIVSLVKRFTLLAQADVRVDYDRAEALYKQALKVKSKLIDTDHSIYILSLLIAEFAYPREYTIQLWRLNGLN